MKLVKAYNSVSLVLRIVIGMVIGAALALLIPNAAVTAPGIGILLGLLLAEIRDIGRDAVALGAVLECCHFRFPFYSMTFRPA